MTRFVLLLTLVAPLTASLVACDPTTPGADPEPYDECPTDDDFASAFSAVIDGDTMTVTVAHSGCNQAEVTPCWDSTFMESFPVQVNLDLAIGTPHLCDAYFEFDTEVDLAPLKQAYEDAYNSSTGSMVINLDGTSVLYEF